MKRKKRKEKGKEEEGEDSTVIRKRRRGVRVRGKPREKRGWGGGEIRRGRR